MCIRDSYGNEEVKRLIARAVKEDRQLLTHCNGDAAAQQLIDCYGEVKQDLGSEADLRPVDVYKRQGYYYADMLGMKVKQKISEAGIDLTGQLSDLSGSLLLDESVITIEKAEQKDGNTVISFTVSKDKMNELVELLSSQMMSGASNITIESVSGTVTVDKNETLVAETMNIAYTMDTNGETGSANMTMELKDIRFGDNVTVELPDDLDEYVESSDGSIEL